MPEVEKSNDPILKELLKEYAYEVEGTTLALNNLIAKLQSIHYDSIYNSNEEKATMTVLTSSSMKNEQTEDTFAKALQRVNYSMKYNRKTLENVVMHLNKII